MYIFYLLGSVTSAKTGFPRSRSIYIHHYLLDAIALVFTVQPTFEFELAYLVSDMLTFWDYFYSNILSLSY